MVRHNVSYSNRGAAKTWRTKFHAINEFHVPARVPVYLSYYFLSIWFIFYSKDLYLSLPWPLYAHGICPSCEFSSVTVLQMACHCGNVNISYFRNFASKYWISNWNKKNEMKIVGKLIVCTSLRMVYATWPDFVLWWSIPPCFLLLLSKIFLPLTS